MKKVLLILAFAICSIGLNAQSTPPNPTEADCFDYAVAAADAEVPRVGDWSGAEWNGVFGLYFGICFASEGIVLEPIIIQA
jgi:hypothetical protein